MKLTCEKKPITAMVAASSIKEATATILNAKWQEADAYYIQLELLPREERTEENLRQLFSFCAGKPVLVTAYRQGDPDLTDDERADLLLLGLKAGADVLDIMGDLFHPEPDQLTMDLDAIAKQMALIDRIHRSGGQVLMSTHLPVFLPEEEILSRFQEQERRGADILKIVSRADTEEQMLQDLRIAAEAKQHLTKPYLFLGSGAFSRTLRLVGPSLGVCMYLGVAHFGTLDFCDQPALTSASEIRRILEH